MIGKITKTLLTCCFVVVACETELIGISLGANPSSPGGAPPPANQAYEHVASQLDPNGSIYIYWNTEKLLGEIDNSLQAVKASALADANLTASQLAKFEAGFDLVRHILLNSGLEAIRALGVSYRKDDSGMYVGKGALYVPDRSGYLWGSIAKPSHDLTFLKLIPEKTEAFCFFDFDLGTFWGGLSKDLAASGIPEIVTAVQNLPTQVQASTGMSLDDLLGSLGDQIGVIVTLDPQKTTTLLSGPNPAVIPEPAAALVLKLKNDKIFDHVDAIFSTNPGVEKRDQPDLKLRVLKGPEPVNYLTPALARYGDYMILSSSDTLVQGIVDANTGKSQGIRSSAEFNGLSAEMPDKGNSAVYVSKRFQATVAAIEAQYNETQASLDPPTKRMLEAIYRISAEIASYKVTGTTDDSLVTVTKTTKDPNDILGAFCAIFSEAVAQAAITDLKRNNPSGDSEQQPPVAPQSTPPQGTDENDNGAQSVPAQPNPAVATPPQMTQKTKPPQGGLLRGPRAKLTQIKMNLAFLSAAKDQVAKQKNLKDGDPVSREDLEAYLQMWPEPVAGEIYEVGPIGRPPYATATVAIGKLPAGSKIEP